MEVVNMFLRSPTCDFRAQGNSDTIFIRPADKTGVIADKAGEPSKAVGRKV
jgi:hypothetical protein